MTCISFDSNNAEIGDTKLVGDIAYEYKGNKIWEALPAAFTVTHANTVGRDADDSHPASAISRGTSNVDADLTSLETRAAGVLTPFGLTPRNNGIWALGNSFRAYNEYMIYDDVAYSPSPATILPYTVGATPDLGFVYQIKLNSLQKLSGLTEPSDLAQRAPYRTTVAEIATNVFKVNDTLTVSDKNNELYIVANTGVANGETSLDAGVGKVANLAYSSHGKTDLFQRFVNKIVGGRGDIAVQVLGDSTGNDPFEWPRKITVALAAEYPELTVVYKLWDNATSSYFSDEIIQNGTGSRTLTMCNGSFPGAESPHFLGARKTPVKAGFSYFDLVFLNFGHNGGTNQTATQVRDRHMSAYAQYVHNYIGSDIVCIIQNINTSFQDFSYGMADGIARVARELNIGTVDVYRLWSDKMRRDGTIMDWMLDTGPHPNSVGHDVITHYIMAGMQHSGARFAMAPIDTLSVRTKNLMKNGWLSDWASSVPDGYTIYNGNVVRNFDFVETGLYSAKITSTVNGTSLAQIVVENATFLKDSVFFAARVYIPESSTSTNCGRVQLITSLGNNSSVILQIYARGGWVWSCAYLPKELVAGASTITAQVLGGNVGDVVYLDRCVLGSGLIPTDAELDGKIPQLIQYFIQSNVGSYANNPFTVTGDDVQVISGETAASFYVTILGLQVGSTYQATWAAPSNTGNVFIRNDVNGTGTYATVSMGALTATFVATAYGQSLDFRPFTGQTTLNINDISIIKV